MRTLLQPQPPPVPLPPPLRAPLRPSRAYEHACDTLLLDHDIEGALEEGEAAEGEAYFAEPLESSVESNNIHVPAELTQLLIDDALRTESTSNWLDSLNGLEQESELDSGDDWLEAIDEWFTVEEE